MLGHVFNSKKDYLPFNLKPQYLQDTYESKIIQLGHWARWVNTEVEEVRGVKDCLWDLAKENKATVMVTGYNGVKGPKADPTIAGSAIQYLAVNSTLPVLVIKDPRRREQKPDGTYRYGVCYDGSSQAKKALTLAVKMMRPTDRLCTITVKEPNVDDAKVEAMVKEMLAEAGVTGQYIHESLDHSRTESVYVTLKNFLKA